MKKLILTSVLGLICFVCDASAQVKTEPDVSQKPQAELVDNVGNIGSEDRSARIDGLMSKVESARNSKGVIVIFCGKACQYGEMEAHVRGINQKLNNRIADKTKYPVIIGGYRNQTSVELWFVPENACLPVPKSDFKIEDVIFKGTFKRKVVDYDCC